MNNENLFNKSILIDIKEAVSGNTVSLSSGEMNKG